MESQPSSQTNLQPTVGKPDFFLSYLENKCKHPEQSLSQAALSSLENIKSSQDNSDTEKKLQLQNDNQELYKKCREIYLEAQKAQSSNDSSTMLHTNGKSSYDNSKQRNSDGVTRISHLVFFCKHFSDPAKRNAFKAGFESIKSSISLDSCPDFDIFLEFYEKALGFRENNTSDQEQLARSISELEHYVNGSQSIALHQRSYHYLMHTVEKIITSQYFGQAQQRKASFVTIDEQSSPKMSPLHAGAEVEKRERKMSAKSPAFLPNKASRKESLLSDFSLNGEEEAENSNVHLVKTTKLKKQKSQDKLKNSEEKNGVGEKGEQEGLGANSEPKLEGKIKEQNYKRKESNGENQPNYKHESGRKNYVPTKVYFEKKDQKENNKK